MVNKRAFIFPLLMAGFLLATVGAKAQNYELAGDLFESFSGQAIEMIPGSLQEELRGVIPGLKSEFVQTFVDGCSEEEILDILNKLPEGARALREHGSAPEPRISRQCRLAAVKAFAGAMKIVFAKIPRLEALYEKQPHRLTGGGHQNEL